MENISKEVLHAKKNYMFVPGKILILRRDETMFLLETFGTYI